MQFKKAVLNWAMKCEVKLFSSTIFLAWGLWNCIQVCPHCKCVRDGTPKNCKNNHLLFKPTSQHGCYQLFVDWIHILVFSYYVIVNECLSQEYFTYTMQICQFYLCH